jgi:hypothetical protein
MTIAIRASGNAQSLHHHEEEHELNEHQIVDSSFTAIINAPIDKVDIPEWCFGLSEQEYQGCSPAHIAAGFTTAPDGKRMSINVEIIGGSMIVEHYIETLGTKSHLILDSTSDVFTPNGRTTIHVTWELSVKDAGGGKCEFTNRVQTFATEDLLTFLFAPSASLRPSHTIKVRHLFSRPASSGLRSGNDMQSVENPGGIP